MIKRSIFRNAGVINWDTEFKDVINIFKMSPRVQQCVVIQAPEKGFGKSTAFEYLAPKFKGITIEGDIISLLARVVQSGAVVHPSTKMSDLGKLPGKTFEVDVPNLWEYPIRKQDVRKSLSTILGENWHNKVSLATAAYGLSSTTKLYIIPDFKFYQDMLQRRVSAMLKDETSLADHVKKFHHVLNWNEFTHEISDMLKRIENERIPHHFIINFSPTILAQHLDVWMRNDVTAISTIKR